MHEFDELVKITDHLLGPNGCPWDQEQTLDSTRAGVLEEVCELIEAIDLNDSESICEELGDLMFNAVFLCRLAEKEKQCDLKAVLLEINEKLIRRHPHVFGQIKLESNDELLMQWEKIKSSEKGKENRTSLLDGIPKGLPALSRAQKILKKTKKHPFAPKIEVCEHMVFQTEEELGQELLAIVMHAQKLGLDSEQALKKSLTLLEEQFRANEQKQSPF